MRITKMLLCTALCTILASATVHAEPIFEMRPTGQLSTFETTDRTITWYPSGDGLHSVKVESLVTGSNNFWYEFIKAAGMNFADVKTTDDDIMYIQNGNKTYAYYQVDEDYALMAQSDTLCTDYVLLGLRKCNMLTTSK